MNKNILVIGNGIDILENEYGTIIDNNFCNIIRCNKAPITDYEKYVGSKTNNRVTYSGLLKNITKIFPSEKNILISIPNFKIQQFRHYLRISKSLKKNNIDIEIKITTREFMLEIYENYQIINPSVGFVALYYFSEKFKKKIYYIGFDGYSNEKSHYYHKKETNKVNNFHRKNANTFHNIKKENEVLDKFKNNILIHLKYFKENKK
jgi:hypothetical protein